jgi:hypothetical protein
MIAEGLQNAGQTALAATLRDHSKRLIDQAGFAEYFDPTNGDGLGGQDFSWTAAIYLMLSL